jgi:TonB-dependent receptor
MHTRAILAALLTLCTLTTPALVAQDRTGTITGTVVDSTRGEALPGAVVRLEGAEATASTDARGFFRLVGVPAGDQMLVVTYLGRREARASVAVNAGDISRIAIQLQQDYAYSESVTVRGETILEGQARALNQQRSAPNIMNIVAADQIGTFPDLNAAEAISRIPGVSIERDQGEGRYVLIRGTEARLNSVLLNGERLPSPEGDIRNVMLDTVPSDLLQSIEVSKAITPDMDGDAIGGTVNLVTKGAGARAHVLGTIAGGYNALMKEGDQLLATFSAGRRFSSNRLGIMLGGSTNRANRGSDSFEVAYDDGDLEELDVRDYTISRQRRGLNATVDFRPGPSNAFTFRGTYSGLDDDEIRRRTVFKPLDGEVDKEMKDRFETAEIFAGSLAWDRVIGSGAMFDARVSAAVGREDEPRRYDTTFRQEDVEMSPNVSPSSIDPDNIQANPSDLDPARFYLDEQLQEINYTRERDVVGALNWRVPLSTRPNGSTFLKIGAKYRHKNKLRDNDAIVFESDDDLAIAPYVDGSFSTPTFLRGRYEPRPVLVRDMRNMRDTIAGEIEFDHESDASDYDATEHTVGVYGMGELFVGRITLLPGLRYERTAIDYTGRSVAFDEDGDYERTSPVSGTSDYGVFMPMVHLKYAVSEEANLRAAVTRTLSRPNYFSLVPYELVFREDEELERGNSSLRPTTSWNVDVMAERYFQSVGIMSAGVFYKNLNDYIYNFTFEEDRNGVEFDVLEPRNGRSARLYGFELALQNQLRFLPGPLAGLGVYANYTFTDSEATFPDRSEGISTLPGQSQHVGNLALWFERWGFSGRASWNFHGRYISEVGEDAAEDVYYDDHIQLDLSFSQTVSRRLRLFADFNNLTNAPLRYYVGVTSRPQQEEYYRWWSTFGVKVNW